MKTDVELMNDVTTELAWDPAIHASGIGVTVTDGIVNRPVF
jgi:hypothetical protein